MITTENINDHFVFSTDSEMGLIQIENLHTGKVEKIWSQKITESCDVPMLDKMEVTRLRLLHHKIARKKAVPNHQNRLPKSQNQLPKKLIKSSKDIDF